MLRCLKGINTILQSETNPLVAPDITTNAIISGYRLKIRVLCHPDSQISAVHVHRIRCSSFLPETIQTGTPASKGFGGYTRLRWPVVSTMH